MLSSTLLASPTQTSQLKTSYTPTKPSNNTKQFSKYPTNIPSQQALTKPKFKHLKLPIYFSYRWQKPFTYIF